MRILLVVNAFASSVTARNTVVVQRALGEQADVETVETNRRGHATRYAHDAARRGLDAVVAFGGDGTVNEVATGVAGTEAALGVLPGGSTNVFARTLGLANDPVKAVQQVSSGLATRSFERIGLGHVNGRSFCFHTGVGFDAAVVREVERHASLKRWLGHPLFIYSALKTWAAGYDRTRAHFRVCGAGGGVGGAGGGGGDHFEVVDGYFTIVLNTNPYTYLGNRPLDLSPSARLDRPLVAVTFRTMRASSILRSLGGALRGGGVEPSAHLDIRTDLAALTIRSEQPFPYQVDGDDLGDTHELRFRHVPDAIRLISPGHAPARRP